MMWDLWWDTEEIFAMILEQADKFPKTFLDRVSSKPRLLDKTHEAFGIENANVGCVGGLDLISRACDTCIYSYYSYFGIGVSQTGDVA